MVKKATPTEQLLKEYGNYALMVGFGGVGLSILYRSATGDWPDAQSVGVGMSAAISLPAVAMAGRSLTRLFSMVSIPEKTGVMHASQGEVDRETIRVYSGGKTQTLFRSAVRLIPISTEKEQPRPRKHPMAYWDVRVQARSSVNDVRLYQDLVTEILAKAWRRQYHGAAHPLSRKAMLGLKYGTTNGRRLSVDEFLAFVELADSCRVIDGRRQGSAGKLLGDPAWCMGRIMGNSHAGDNLHS